VRGLPDPVVYGGTPAALEASWMAWCRGDPGTPKVTVVPNATWARHLERRLIWLGTPQVDHRIATLFDLAWTVRPRHRGFLPDTLAPFVLGPALEDRVGYRPSDTATWVRVALALNRVDQASVPAGSRAADVRHLEAVQRLLEAFWPHGYDAARLYRYAATHVPRYLRGVRLAFYGPFDLWPDEEAWVQALGEAAAEVSVWMPRTGSSGDRLLLPWTRFWRKTAARFESLPMDGRGTVRAVSHPGADPAAVWRSADVRGEVERHLWTVLVPDRAARAPALARLHVRGVTAVEPGSESQTSERLLTAWAASSDEATAEHVLAWLGVREPAPAPGLLQAVASRPGHPTAWPDEVRGLWSVLRDAATALREAGTWLEAGRALPRFLAAAGVGPIDVDDAHRQSEAWHAAGWRPDRAAVEAWVMTAGQVQAPMPAAGAVWVTTPWELAGAWLDRTVVVKPDLAAWLRAPSDDSVRIQDELDRLLPRRVTHRRRLAQYVRQWVVRAASTVWVVGNPVASWLADEDGWEEPPAEQGPGLSVAMSRRRPAFGPFDGQFAPGHLRRPTSASGFETYGRCPLRYAFDALAVEPWPELGLEPDAATTGAWAHRVLQKLANVDRPPAGWAQAVKDALAAVVRDSPPPASVPPWILEAVVDRLGADLAWFVARFGTAGTAEQAFSLDTAVGPLRGSIDRVVVDGDGVTVIDFKTGPLPGARLAPDSLQLAVYAWAAHELYRQPLEQIRVGYVGVTRRNDFHAQWVQGSSAWWQTALEMMREMADRVERGAAYAYPRPGACRSCEIRVACPFDAERLGLVKAAQDADFRRLWEEEPGDGDAAD
jgi:RecB family exonuclease